MQECGIGETGWGAQQWLSVGVCSEWTVLLLKWFQAVAYA